MSYRKARSSLFTQRKNISRHYHVMDSSQLSTFLEATCSILSHLSFSQVLLVATYMLLWSCLPYQIGDDRQILDILRCEEKDWRPRLGSNRLSESSSCNRNAMVALTWTESGERSAASWFKIIVTFEYPYETFENSFDISLSNWDRS